MLDQFAWVAQDVTLPLYGVLVILLLPVQFIAKILREQITKRTENKE